MPHDVSCAVHMQSGKDSSWGAPVSARIVECQLPPPDPQGEAPDPQGEAPDPQGEVVVRGIPSLWVASGARKDQVKMPHLRDWPGVSAYEHFSLPAIVIILGFSFSRI